MKNKLYYGDNLDVLRKYIKDESVHFYYIKIYWLLISSSLVPY